jgi:hypothetical protein
MVTGVLELRRSAGKCVRGVVHTLMRLSRLAPFQGPAIPKSSSPMANIHYPSLGRFGAASDEVDDFLSDERFEPCRSKFQTCFHIPLREPLCGIGPTWA